MVLFPSAQEAAHAELDRVIGQGRLPQFEDRQELPYIEALVKEVLRFFVVAPLGASAFMLGGTSCHLLISFCGSCTTLHNLR